MNIIDMEVRTTPGIPLKERAQRKRIVQTTVAKIKSLEHECINICDEGTHIWTKITINQELQSLEDKIRSKQEEVLQATKRVNMLPPIEIILVILDNMKLYNILEQMKE